MHFFLFAKNKPPTVKLLLLSDSPKHAASCKPQVSIRSGHYFQISFLFLKISSLLTQVTSKMESLLSECAWRENWENWVGLGFLGDFSFSLAGFQAFEFEHLFGARNCKRIRTHLHPSPFSFLMEKGESAEEENFFLMSTTTSSWIHLFYTNS